MFIAVVFTVAKLWTQPRYLPTDEWIKEMLYGYNVVVCVNNTLKITPEKQNDEVMNSKHFLLD